MCKFKKPMLPFIFTKAIVLFFHISSLQRKPYTFDLPKHICMALSKLNFGSVKHICFTTSNIYVLERRCNHLNSNGLQNCFLLFMNKITFFYSSVYSYFPLFLLISLRLPFCRTHRLEWYQVFGSRNIFRGCKPMELEPKNGRNNLCHVLNDCDDCQSSFPVQQ